MKYPYPATCASDIDKLRSLFRGQELLRFDHNARMPSLSPKERFDYVRNYFEPRMNTIALDKGLLLKSLSMEQVTPEAAINHIAVANAWRDFKAAAKAEVKFDVKVEDIPLLGGISFPDAVENFTQAGWTEVDAGGKLTVTANDVTWTNMARNVDSYEYEDQGAGFKFDGDFEHLFDTKCDTAADIYLVHVWMLAESVIDDGYAIRGTVGQYSLFSQWYNLDWYLVQCTGNHVLLWDSYAAPVQSTWYYMKNKRDEAVGANGTLYGYVYSDAARTILLDTLTVTLGAKEDLQIAYAVNSYNDANATACSGQCANLDFQGTGAPAPSTGAKRSLVYGSLATSPLLGGLVK